MRLISMLIALLIIGFLVYKQVGKISNKKVESAAVEVESAEAPKMPTNMNEVKQFEVQINNYVKEEAAQRARKLDELDRP